MSKMNRILLWLLGVAVAASLFFAVREWYEADFLSPDIKSMLVSAMDQSMSLDLVQSTLRDAQYRARTDRDAEVVDKFERAVQLTVEADQIRSGIMDQAAGSQPTSTEHGSDMNTMLDEQLAHTSNSTDLQTQTGQLSSDQANKRAADLEEAAAQKLYAELRVELGMPKK
jgi:hypothetical protein